MKKENKLGKNKTLSAALSHAAAWCSLPHYK